jgi:hypothetical protein
MGRKKSFTYDTSQPELVVYRCERRVGTIGQTEDGNVWFKYDATVVADADGNGHQAREPRYNKPTGTNRVRMRGRSRDCPIGM